MINDRKDDGFGGDPADITCAFCGKTPQEVTQLLKGIHCGNKETSCPDQLARALEEIAERV